MIQPVKLSAVSDTVIERFKLYYRDMVEMDVAKLGDLYDANVVFKDPVHQIKSLATLQDYLADLLTHVKECRFEFLDQIEGNQSAYVKWNMHFRHPKLANGQMLSVRGVSHIQFNEKIYYHEDIYDLGEMLYEHVPLLGNINRGIKNRLSGNL